MRKFSIKKVYKCRYCDTVVSKDERGLYKKLIDHNARDNYLCITCIAEGLECTVEDLQYKIEEFKNEGCVLFG
jgi:DNA-directed RNA polymerase subunit RPC12/RpoP